MSAKTRLRQLKQFAERAAVWRGHALGKWTITTNRITGRGSAVAACSNPQCCALAQVITHPQPNGMDIGGTAMRLNCPVAAED